MSRKPDQLNDGNADEPTKIDRRKILTAGAAGLAALASGAAIAETVAPKTYPWQEPGDAGRFADKVVLITGATSGIGEATARAFAAEGAKVFFCGRREELGRSVEASIRENGGDATYMRADVREEADVGAFVKACRKTYGSLDIAFNNAGIGGPAGPYATMALDGIDGYHDLIRTNLDGVFYAMRHEIPVMLKQGHGVIVNTASMLGSTGSPGVGPYSATKHGVIGLTRSAAKLHARENLRILSVSPGPIDTPLLRRGTGGDLSGLAAANPSGRVGQPQEVAAMVLNLAAPEAAYVTGEDFKVDGGASA